MKESKLEAPNLGYTKHKNSVLLPNQVYCMHCGKRLTTTINIKTYTRKDGSTVSYQRLKYICINKSSLHPCDGQKSYSVNLIDTSVLKLFQLSLFSNTHFSLIPDAHSAVAHQKELQDAVEQERASLETLKHEVVNVLQGTSAFGSVLIRDLIQQSESRLLILNQELIAVQEEMDQRQAKWARFLEFRKSLIASGVSDLSTLPFPQRREIAHVLISRIELGRDGSIKIEWSYGGAACLPPRGSD